MAFIYPSMNADGNLGENPAHSLYDGSSRPTRRGVVIGYPDQGYRRYVRLANDRFDPASQFLMQQNLPKDPGR